MSYCEILNATTDMAAAVMSSVIADVDKAGVVVVGVGDGANTTPGGGSHWATLAIQLRNKQCVYYDSLRNQQCYANARKIAKNILAAVYPGVCFMIIILCDIIGLLF